VHFAGTDRQPDGTWRTARFDVLGGDGTEATYIIDEDALGRLPEIRDVLAATGIAVLGGDYLETMVEWVDEHMPPPARYAIRSKRSGRYVSHLSPKGRAVTRKLSDDAFTSSDRRRVARFLARSKLAARGYAVVSL
jgi:hypothetical protein